MKKYFFILFILSIAQVLQSSFLKIDDTAISFGLGSTGVSYIRGASSMLVNPASTYYRKAFNITLSQYMGPESIACSYIGAVKGIPKFGALGLALKSLYPLDEIKMINEKGEYIGEQINFYSYLIDINFSHRLITLFDGYLYSGYNLKYIEQGLWKYISYGFAADIGILYRSRYVRDLKIGVSYQNIGKLIKNFLDEQMEYPEIFRAGISFSDNIFIENLKAKRNLFFMLDLILSTGIEADYLCFGSEYKYKRFLSIKAGYRMRLGTGFQDAEFLRNFRCGIGIKLKRMRLDYSFIPKSNPANQFINIISISIMMI